MPATQTQTISFLAAENALSAYQRAQEAADLIRAITTIGDRSWLLGIAVASARPITPKA